MNWTVYRRIIKAKQLNSEQQGCQSKTWTVQCKVGFPKQNMNCTVYSRVNKKQNKNWTVYSKVKKAKHEQYSVQQGCQSKTWTIQCTAGLTKQNMNFLFFWLVDLLIGLLVLWFNIILKHHCCPVPKKSIELTGMNVKLIQVLK